MDEEQEFSRELLPGQFSMTEALCKAIETAGEAYRLELYQEDWPDVERARVWAQRAPEQANGQTAKA